MCSRTSLLCCVLLLGSLGCEPPDESIGGVPTQLAAEVEPNRVTLTWRDNSNNELRSSIERSEVSATEGLSEVASVVANTTRYRDTEVEVGKTYWYRVIAVNRLGHRAPSEPLQVVVESAANPPLAPTDLVATPASTASITLTWKDGSTDEEGFTLERALASEGPWASVGQVPAEGLTFTDSGLTANTPYFYRVLAFNASGPSEPSALANATTLEFDDTEAPSVPTGVTATALSATEVKVTWTPSTDSGSGLAGYKIYQGTTLVKTDPATTYTATALAPATQHCYAIEAVDKNANVSAKTAPACATTQAAMAAPSAPTGLTATAKSGSQIDLVWVDAAANEQGFKVERGTAAAGPFAQVGTAGVNATAYSDNTGLSAATAYHYRVRAYNAVGNSAFTATASATTLVPPPTAPSAPTAAALTANSIKINWTDNSGNETAFVIEHATTAAGPFAKLAPDAPANAVTHTHSGLVGSSAHFYKVRAINAGGSSASTAVVNATTLAAPAPPTAPVATVVSATEIKLAWTDASNNETGFRIDRATAMAGPFTQVVITAANIATYSVTALTANTTYYFRIRSVNANGLSTSATVNAKTAP